MTEKLQGTIAQVSQTQAGVGIRLNEYDGWFNCGKFYKAPPLDQSHVGRAVELTYTPTDTPNKYFLNGITPTDGQALWPPTAAAPSPAPVAAAPVPPAPAPSTTGPQPVPTSYQGFLEAAAASPGTVPLAVLGLSKDVQIVRQSCLKAAVELAIHKSGDADLSSIFGDAELMEAWVFRQEESEPMPQEEREPVEPSP